MMESDYSVIKELGEGSFGKVYLVKQGDNKFFAKKEMTDGLDILVGVKEMNIVKMASSISPYVVKIEHHHMSVSGRGKYQIDQYLEYCQEGCLGDIIDEENDYPDRQLKAGYVGKRISELSDLAVGLATLHRNGIYHMDMKLDNILYRSSGMCLCDFSNSIINTPWRKSFQPPPNQYHSLVYRSPDIALLRTSWGNAEKSDVWGLGIIMMEILGLKNNICNFESDTDNRISRFSSIVSRFKARDSRSVMAGSPVFGRLFPGDMSGWDLTKKTSDTYGYLWCNIFTRNFRNMDYEKMFSESLEYFRVRKCQITDEEERALRNVITNIIPKMLNVDHTSRLTMEEVCAHFGRTVPDVGLEKSTERKHDLGTLWEETVADLREELKDVTILCATKSIPIPDQVLMFAKAISETSMLRITPPENKNERCVFYRNMFGASLLLSCEMYDYMIEVDEEEYVIPGKMSLADLGPYVVDITNQTAGKLFTITPSEEELKNL